MFLPSLLLTPILLLQGKNKKDKALMSCKHCSAIAKTSVFYQHCFVTSLKHGTVQATMKKMVSWPKAIHSVNQDMLIFVTAVKEALIANFLLLKRIFSHRFFSAFIYIYIYILYINLCIPTNVKSTSFIFINYFHMIFGDRSLQVLHTYPELGQMLLHNSSTCLWFLIQIVWPL